jgi:tetratricopeptide (TPR) repeat protein
MKSLFLCVACAGLASLPVFADNLDPGIEAYRKNNFADAVTNLRNAIGEDENSARAHAYLAMALLEQGKTAEAEPHVTKANEISPSGESKLALARLYVEKRDFAKAQEALNEASGDEVAWVRGLMNFHKKDNEAAVRDLEQYLEAHPEFAYAHYYAGMAYSAIRRPDKMLTHFEQFLRMKPDAPEARKVQAVMRATR